MCARRDTSVDGTGASTAIVVDNDPKIQFDARAEISLTAQYRLCTCGGRTTSANGASCSPLAVPARTHCVHAKRCYDAVDRLPCRPFDLGSLAEIGQLPACSEALDKC